MIVNRRVFVAKPGKTSRMVEKLIESHKRGSWSGKVRIYKCEFGPSFQHVVVEAESESLAAYAEEAPTFDPKMTAEERAERQELEASAKNEIWELVYEQEAQGDK